MQKSELAPDRLLTTLLPERDPLKFQCASIQADLREVVFLAVGSPPQITGGTR